MAEKSNRKEKYARGAGLFLLLGGAACGNTKQASEPQEVTDWLNSYEIASEPAFNKGRINFEVSKVSKDGDDYFDVEAYCRGKQLVVASHVMQSAVTQDKSPICADKIANQQDWQALVTTLGFSNK